MSEFSYSIFREYSNKLRERDELKAQLSQVEDEIKEMDAEVAQAMEMLGTPQVDVGGYKLGFKTYRNVKYTGDVPRQEIAAWLRRNPETEYLVEEKFNLVQVSAHFRRDEEAENRENLPPGLQWSEATVLHPTKSSKKS